MTHPSLLDPDEPTPLSMTVADLVARHGFGPVSAEVAMHTPLRIVPSAPARAGDPETSQVAGPRSNDTSRFSERSRSGRLMRVFASGSFTDHEATLRVVGAGAPPSIWEGCRRRCSDLRAANYLVDSGERRQNPGSPDEAIVWSISLAGVKAISNLDERGWSR